VQLSTKAGEGATTAYFGKLQMDLLRAYDPRFNIPGRPANESLQPEASNMHDVLLGHQKLVEFGSEALSSRTKDENDLVARCLPLFKAANPLEAWAKILGNDKAMEHPRWGWG
jgi:hypothetical protein